MDTLQEFGVDVIDDATHTPTPIRYEMSVMYIMGLF